MRSIGMFATVLGLMLIVGGVLLFIRSLPEIRRYLNIREM